MDTNITINIDSAIWADNRAFHVPYNVLQKIDILSTNYMFSVIKYHFNCTVLKKQ